MSRSKSQDRMSAAVVAEVAAARAKRQAARGQLPAIDAANAKPNLSGPEQTALLRELSSAVERIIRGGVGG